MKKIMAFLLILAMAFSTLIGCASQSSSSGKIDSDKTDKKQDVSVAVICDKIGTNPFLTQLQDGLKESGEKYGIKTQIIESADAGVWEDNIRAAVEENYDLVVAVGGQGADPISRVASQFPDKAKYVMIDVVSDNPNVKSIVFKEQEGAYLIGMIAALVSKDNDVFGAVHASQSQSSFKWRWGYMEGVKSINPNAKFIFNYTGSYSDAGKAKELALQQAAQGAKFINAASAVADFGTFEAALEKGFYTAGQDMDRSTPDNPNIITTQVKDTSVVIKKVIDEFMSGELNTEFEQYGIKEGVIGAVHITKESINPRNKEVLTDEIVEKVKKVADDIASGKLVLEVPEEEDYVQ